MWTYEVDEVPKRKHHWTEPFAGFVERRGVPIGKCPATLSLVEAEHLLNAEPIDPELGERCGAPLRLYAVDERLMDGGHSSELGFRVLWDRTEATGGATDATRGRLTAIVAGTVVWGLPNARAEDGVEWTWVELLEHLAEHWTALTWEELDPLGQGCLCRHLRAEAEARWQGLSSAVVETEEEALWRFEQRHDLATALQGAWPGSLWILRRGKSCLVEGGERSIVLPFASVLATLEALGERIVARLTGLADARSRAALKLWSDRERSSLRDSSCGGSDASTA